MAFTLHDLLRHLVHIRASDLLLKAGQPPLFRLHGDLLPLHAPALSAEEVEELAQHILRPDQRERFEREREMTVTYQLKNVARYRVTLLQQQGGPSLSVRAIPLHPPSLEELNLPPLCREFCERPQGLILVTGPAGSGKSTTLAALVHHLNSTRALHILTIEEPIEFVHQDLKSFLSQREVGEDTPSFAAALRQALHQDADVILVSELRELEAISLALAAAETGHLVLAALPATDAVQTIERIVEVFPLPQQQRIRLQLAA
ncbi:MAG TPA: PilT/PilU family type 4a pilus ATPase, partial [Armatimonadetes bacterium]|nr:PilT/PilU family type 4a pilus ATPase [Armatimonadota bacterium]